MPSINRIQIEQQVASIGIRTQNAQMRITTPRPKMTLKNEIPKPHVSTTKAKFKVNWQKVRNESGLKSPGDLALTNRNKALMKTSQALDTLVSNGEYVAKVEQPGNRIAQLAHQNTIKDKRKDINVGLMPQSSPEITWEPGNISIEWSKSGLVIEWENTGARPEIEVDPPYSVEIYLESMPYIRITVAEADAPYAPGKVVDENI